ncbi:MAG: di-heme enzyme [Thiotrichaceae bacterium]|nr:di-heme enzyme [Thiotrichaceae bacterium]
MKQLFHFCLYLGMLSLNACGGGGGDSASSANSSTASTNSTPTPTKTVFSWQLPTGFPEPRIPDDNPITTEKIALGKYLFYDNRLSITNTQACAGCHLQNKAFTDGLKTAIGSTGDALVRNSMSLTNVVYNSRFNWANPQLKTLHAQAKVPMFAEFPVELGWSNNEQKILDRLRVEPLYKDLFTKAFPNETEPFTEGNVAKAIANFVSTLISGNSSYDQVIYQQKTAAMSDSAKRGRDLFFSERLECFHCHGGFNFSQSVNHQGTVFDEIEYHNNGLYNLENKGLYPMNNRGLWDVTFINEDMGRFRAPTLRNIELTAPYMHDGSIATLEEVLEHYARGGRLIESGEFAGDGAKNPYKSNLINGFVLTTDEKQDVINFLKSLTDWEFICNRNFSDPFGNQPMHAKCQ